MMRMGLLGNRGRGVEVSGRWGLGVAAALLVLGGFTACTDVEGASQELANGESSAEEQALSSGNSIGSSNNQLLSSGQLSSGVLSSRSRPGPPAR